MILTTEMNPGFQNDPVKEMPGIGGIQQKLPKMKHDTGKSAAGSQVDVLRTPYTLFRSTIQLIYNIEILLRYKYKDNVHDMNAIHKYVEYLMVAIRKDINFYAETISRLLDILPKHSKEELMQVNETFNQLVQQVSIIFNEAVEKLPNSLDDYDFQCIQDDLVLALPKHPLMDDSLYVEREDELEFECDYFHVLLFTACHKIAIRYYCCSQYALSGCTNVAFSRSANIDQIKRSLYSLVDLCVPFYSLLQSKEFDISEYEASHFLFKSDSKLKFPISSSMALAIQLKQANKQRDLNAFLNVLPRCPFVLLICALTYLPFLIQNWLRLNYSGLSPQIRDLQSMVDTLLPNIGHLYTEHHCNLNFNKSYFVRFIDLIIRDNLLFCPSNKKEEFLESLKQIQTAQSQQLKKANQITFDSKSNSKDPIMPIAFNWKCIPFHPQINEQFYKPSKYVVVQLHDLSIDFSHLLLEFLFKTNPFTVHISWISKEPIVPAIVNTKSPSKSLAILAQLNKSKESHSSQLKKESSTKDKESAITEDQPPDSPKINLSSTTFPNAENYDPHQSNDKFSFARYSTRKISMKDVEMEDLTPTKAIEVTKVIEPPQLELKDASPISDKEPSKTVDIQAKASTPVHSFSIPVPQIKHSAPPKPIQPTISLQPPITFSFIPQPIPSTVPTRSHSKFHKIDIHRIFQPVKEQKRPLSPTISIASTTSTVIHPDYDVYLPLKKRKLESISMTIDYEPVQIDTQTSVISDLIKQSNTVLRDQDDIEMAELMKECEMLLK